MVLYADNYIKINKNSLNEILIQKSNATQMDRCQTRPSANSKVDFFHI